MKPARKGISPYRYTYLEREADVAVEKIRKTDKKKGEELFAYVALRTLEKLEDRIISESDASKIFSRFLPFAYSYFSEEASEIIRVGCLLPLPKRPLETDESISRMKIALKKI